MLAVVKRVVGTLIDSIAALDDGFEHREPDDPLSRILVALQDVIDVIDQPEPFVHPHHNPAGDGVDTMQPHAGAAIELVQRLVPGLRVETCHHQHARLLGVFVDLDENPTVPPCVREDPGYREALLPHQGPVCCPEGRQHGGPLRRLGRHPRRRRQPLHAMKDRRAVVAEREELTETGLGSTARCRGRRRHRQANSVRVCAPTSRRVASLRPRSAGLTALTPAPRTARPDWLLPTMLTHTPPTCCGRRPVQNDALSGDR